MASRWTKKYKVGPMIFQLQMIFKRLAKGVAFVARYLFVTGNTKNNEAKKMREKFQTLRIDQSRILKCCFKVLIQFPCENLYYFFYHNVVQIISSEMTNFRCVSDKDIIAKGAYVGLAPPGDAGSWQRECKVCSQIYIFFTPLNITFKCTHSKGKKYNYMFKNM